MIDGWPSAQGCSVLAHRGGAALGPANSIAAIERSAAAGAHAMELDLQELADGSLVLHHDSKVARGDTRVPLAELNLVDLRRLVTGPVPTLESALLALRQLGCGLYLDVKRVTVAGLESAIDLVCATGVGHSTVVGSFDLEVAARVAADGRLRSSVLYHDAERDPLELRAQTGCAVVHPCFDDHPEMVAVLAGEWMDRAHASGLAVVGWNSNDAALLASMRAAGFDAICTDDPPAARVPG